MHRLAFAVPTLSPLALVLGACFALGACFEGAPTPAPELQITRVSWRAPGLLEVGVRLENDGPTTRALDLDRFEVATAEGAHWAATPYDGVGTCGTWIEAGSTERCALRFELDGAPVELAYLAEPPRVASVLACAPTSPEGLCPLGQTCVDGTCQPFCSTDRWDGVCLPDHLVCERGRCVERCHPDGGGCGEGVCVEGACVDACPAIGWTDEACAACLGELAGRCALEDARCETCVRCEGGRTCECLTSSACDGCAEDAARVWGCVLEACPACGD